MSLPQQIMKHSRTCLHQSNQASGAGGIPNETLNFTGGKQLRKNNRKNDKINRKNEEGNKKKSVFLPGEANEGVFKGQVIANDNGPFAGKFRNIHRKFFN